MSKEQEFLSLINHEKAEELAKYIVDIFGTKENEIDLEKNIDVNFHLKAGQMEKDGNQNTNTWFKFDTQEGTLCRKILDFLCDEELDAEEVREQFETFRNSVESIIESKYSNVLREKIRKYVFPSSPEILFPLKEIKVNFLEISEKPPIDFTIAIQKCSPPGEQTSQVSQDLLNTYLETREDLNDIVARKKAEGNENYKYVVGVKKTKAFYEVNLDLYVDFSVDTDLINNEKKDGQ